METISIFNKGNFQVNLNILFWVLFVLSIAVVIWFVVGDSPTLEQALLIVITTFLFTIYGSTRENKAKLIALEKSFIKLAADSRSMLKNENPNHSKLCGIFNVCW